jgi:hypothetical protein
MEKFQLLKRLLIVFSLPLLVVACDDEDEATTTTDFGTIASTYEEADGTGTVTIPLRNAGNSSNLSVEFGGSAIEGDDYELVGITSEGVQISINDDNNLEPIETVRVRLVSSGGSLKGNTFHTISIVSNCEDTDNPDISHFVGDYDATEKYGPTEDDWYGPYEIHLVQDEEDPNMFHFDNFYDSGCDAYMVFDLANGTVHFPDQAPCGVDLTNSSGTFEIDACNGSVLNINVNFDGGDWLYTFEKHL